jgi:splicing factor U2AF 65 kDa subunit
LAPVGAEIPTLDVSRIGIISPTVLDGPNKIFIGGLHYYYTEPQVLELLRAFGKVKAFHLVKNDPESNTSKGYCFVEYVDPAVTLGAVQGLNGMDIGDGKSLTARVAGGAGASSNVSSGTFTTEDQPPIDSTVVDGYDIESLVDAALGRRPMPTGPTYVDGTTGAPITRIKPGHIPPKVTLPSIPPPLPVPMMMGNHNMPSLSMLPSVLSSIPTRILVLLNMVSMEDLESEDSHADLMDEVRGECAKFGTILRLVIPRAPTDLMAPSSVRKIYLEYGTVPEAMAAQEALSGRQFGDAVVGTEYYPERDFAQGRLV